jgi:hypothetical protein
MVAVPSFRNETASGDFIFGSCGFSLTVRVLPVRGRMLKTCFV